MKQSIIVPNQVTSPFFNLPCIEGAYKDEDNAVRCYLIKPRYTTNGDYMMAYPGDTLIEEDNGKWRVEKNQK